MMMTCGLSIEQLNEITERCNEDIEKIRFSEMRKSQRIEKRKMSAHNMILLTLIHLKSYDTNSNIALQFGISPSYAGAIISKVLLCLFMSTLWSLQNVFIDFIQSHLFRFLPLYARKQKNEIEWPSEEKLEELSKMWPTWNKACGAIDGTHHPRRRCLSDISRNYSGKKREHCLHSLAITCPLLDTSLHSKQDFMAITMTQDVGREVTSRKSGRTSSKNSTLWQMEGSQSKNSSLPSEGESNNDLVRRGKKHSTTLCQGIESLWRTRSRHWTFSVQLQLSQGTRRNFTRWKFRHVLRSRS